MGESIDYAGYTTSWGFAEDDPLERYFGGSERLQPLDSFSRESEVPLRLPVARIALEGVGRDAQSQAA